MAGYWLTDPIKRFNDMTKKFSDDMKAIDSGHDSMLNNPEYQEWIDETTKQCCTDCQQDIPCEECGSEIFEKGKLSPDI